MASHDITIIVRAKNAIAAGLAAAKKGLTSFGSGIAKIAHGAKTAFKWVGAAAIGAGVALLAAARKAEEFNEQINQIATISKIAPREAAKEIRKLSAEFGLAKEALTKGLYDALSAGIPKDNAFEFLRTAAITARAGAATTAEAVDLLTTAINSFQIPVGEAGKVADALFTTVRLGKTTISELAASFAEAGPFAAASGVKIEEMLAAVATLTKSGTPTAQAMTQIRAAIVAMNEELGDGWTATMSLQDGMTKMMERAGGSTNALKDLTGRIEGANAIIGVTGTKAAMAASDLDEVRKSAGAADDAFRKMDGGNPLSKLQQALGNIVLTAGDAILLALGPTIERAAKAAANFAERVAEWTQGNRFKRIKADIEGIIDALTSGEKGRQDAMTAIGDVLRAAFSVAAERAVSLLKTAAPIIGKLIGGAAKAALGTVFQEKDYKKAAAQLGMDPGFFGGSFGFKLSDLTDEQHDAIKQQMTMNRQADIFRELGLEGTAAIEGQTAAEKELEDAIKRVHAIADKYRKTVQETPPSTPPGTTPPITSGAGSNGPDKGLTAEEAADRMKSDVAKFKRLLAERIKDEEKATDKLRELAEKRVDEFIAEAEAKKSMQKEIRKEDDRANKLFEKQAKGIKLSKRDQEFLKAHDKILQAKIDLPGKEAQLKADKKRMEQLEKKKILLLTGIRKDLADNLRLN